MIVLEANKQVNEITMSYSGLLFYIASCNYELKNYFEAIQFFNKYLKIKIEKKWGVDEISSIYYSLANCKMNLGDYRGAIKDYQLSISSYTKKHPFERLITLYNSLAFAKLKVADYQNALLALNKATTLPNEGIFLDKNREDITYEPIAYSYYLMGFAKYNLDNKDGACNAWSKAGELGFEGAYEEIKTNCK